MKVLIIDGPSFYRMNQSYQNIHRCRQSIDFRNLKMIVDCDEAVCVFVGREEHPGTVKFKSALEEANIEPILYDTSTANQYLVGIANLAMEKANEDQEVILFTSDTSLLELPARMCWPEGTTGNALFESKARKTGNPLIIAATDLFSR